MPRPTPIPAKPQPLKAKPTQRLTPEQRRLIALSAVSAVVVLGAALALVVVSCRRGASRSEVASSAGEPEKIDFTFGPASGAETNPEANPEANPEPLEQVEPIVSPPTVPAGEPPPQGTPPTQANPSATPPTKTPADPQPVPSKPANPPAKAKAPPQGKSPTKPAPPAPAANPFEGFPIAVSLPPVAQTDPVSLGPVKVPENYICVLYLLGGEGLARGRHVFRCDYAEMGTASRAWEIFARDTGVSAPELLVARLTLAREQLTFAWTADAAQYESAGSLANCALKISAGRGVHTVALRRPKLVSAIPIVYEKQTTTWTDLADTPRTDKAQLEFQITAPKELPRVRFLGKSIVPANQAETWVEFGLKPGERFFRLLIEGQLNVRSLEITVTPFIQLAGQAKPLAVTPDNLKKLEKTLAEAAAPGEARLRALGQTKSKTKPKADSPEAKERDAITKQLAGIRLAQSQLRQFKSLEDRFAKQVKLKVQATHLADQAIVGLVQSR